MWILVDKCKCAKILFFKRFILFIYREGKGGRKTGRETSMYGCLSHAPYWGPGLKPRHVLWLGMEPVTLWFVGRYSITEPHQPGCKNIIIIIIIIFNLYCYSVTVVCLFSPSLYPTPATPTSLPPPLDFVHVSFIVVPVISSPHCPLPNPLWLLLDS